MWQIMWKGRRTSRKWKKRAKNWIFVLVDEGLPKQLGDRTSYLSAPPGRNVTPGAPLANLSQYFFFWLQKKIANRYICISDEYTIYCEWSALHNLSLFVHCHFSVSGKTWHLEHITFRYLKRDIWYVNSHGRFFEFVVICQRQETGWSLYRVSLGFQPLRTF